MPNLYVSYESMNNQAQQLISRREEIDDTLRTVKSQVDALTEGDFKTDTSSPAFQAAYTTFTDGVSKTIQGMDDMANFLQQAAQTMQETDSQLASAIRG